MFGKIRTKVWRKISTAFHRRNFKREKMIPDIPQEEFQERKNDSRHSYKFKEPEEK